MKASWTRAGGEIALVLLLAPLACGSSDGEEPGGLGNAGGTGTEAGIPTGANSGGDSGSVGASGGSGAGSGGSGGSSAASRPCSNPTLLMARAITAGDTYSCALTTTNSVRCWGSNSSGELGDGTTTGRPLSVQATGIANAVGVAASLAAPACTYVSLDLDVFGSAMCTGNHSCAVLEDGSTWCWGYDVPGGADQCSLRDAQSPCALAPLSIAGIANATAIAASGEHTCVILSDGSVACWGRGLEGELGNGTTYGSTTPVAVSGLTQVVALAAGGRSTCALRSDGKVLCWGLAVPNSPSVDINDIPYASSPVEVPNLADVASIAQGWGHTCVVLGNGTVQCWGSNYYGELGNGSTTFSSTPVVVSGTGNAVKVATGNGHTCALLSDGSVACWGRNYFHQLGTNTTDTCQDSDGRNSPCSRVPLPVPGIAGAVSVAAGGNHTCALLSSGAVYCWGANTQGQVGDGTTTDRTTATRVQEFCE
jgi:alpha-tubulin suppressor-like RCC1 family protein